MGFKKRGRLEKVLASVMIPLLVLSIFSMLPLQVKAEKSGGRSVLYAGGHNPGVVYRYLNGIWEPISPELGYAVMDLTMFNGQLYAAVTTGFGGYDGVGKVYRYEGGKKWTLVGDGMDHAVISLAVYNGELYAGTGRGAFRLYKYTPGTTNCGIQDWTKIIDYSRWNGVRSLYVSHGYLLMGDTYYDRIGRWDGKNFYADLDDYGWCIYDFQDFGGYVYAAAYDGRLWRSSDAIHWNVVLGYYDGNMWELEVFQNKLFMAYDNGELRVYDGTGDLRGELVFRAPDSIISMATDGEYLYLGTGGDAVGYGAKRTGIANVYMYDGRNVVQISSEDQMGEGVQVLYVPPEIPWPRFPVENPLKGIYWHHEPGSGRDCNYIPGRCPRGGHFPSGGYGGADDTYALDLNWFDPRSGEDDRGKPVYAIEKGEVIDVDRSYGWVLIKHNTSLQWRGKTYTTWYSGYLHMQNIPLKFKKGVRVEVQKGEQIGEVGSVRADTPHLHFAIYVGYIDYRSPHPYAFLESVDPGQVGGPEYAKYTYGDLEGGGAIYNHNVDEIISQDSKHWFEKGGNNSDWFESISYGFYGHMFYTHVNKGSMDNWGRWNHEILADGKFKIYVFIPRNYATTTKAKYQLFLNGKLIREIIVSQCAKKDEWVWLGDFDFKAGDKIQVFLGDYTGEPKGLVAYDAIKIWAKQDLDLPRD
jgi:murein DD-endopeptidase MepM/ murein hydrolase activator NlpD